MSSIDYADLNLVEWINYPDTTTPLNQTNLRIINGAIAQLVNAINDNYYTKQDSDGTMRWLKNIEFDEPTGIFTVTRVDNSTFTVDTKLEKLAINFRYDSDPTSEHYQSLIITLDDGTLQYVDMSALLTQYEFTDTGTIALNVDNTGKVSANVIDHSIGDTQMQVGYLTNVRQNAQNAATSETNAKTSETNASNSEINSANSATLSQSWAVGGTNTRAGEDTNNSKFWAEKAEGVYQALGSGVHPMGTITFAELPVFESIEPGYMYNISDAFTSDSRFKDGSGVHYDAGANVYAIKEVRIDENDNEVITWYWDVFTPIDMTGKMNIDGSNSASIVIFKDGSLLIGSKNQVPDTDCLLIGASNVSRGSRNLAVGTNNSFDNSKCLAIGTNNSLYSINSTALGSNCETNNSNSLAIGQNGATKAPGSSLVEEKNGTHFAIGSLDKQPMSCEVALPLESRQEEGSGNNIFSVDSTGNTYMHGAPYLVRGVIVGRLVAAGDTFILEDGAVYRLYTHTRITSTGAFRNMQAWLISATFNPKFKSQGTGTTTTAQAIPQIVSVGSVGTVGVNLNRTYEAYTNDLGATAYHSKLGIGTCTTDMTCRYTLVKVVGSEDDFVDDYGL